MEKRSSRILSGFAAACAAVLLAAVMLLCLPQAQALAVEAAGDTAQATTQEFTADKLVGEQPAADAATVENAPKQVGGTGSKYGLLQKDGKLYPCNKKGKKLGTFWKVGSTVQYVFVAPDVKKYTGNWTVRYKSTIKLSHPVSYKIKTIEFLTKNGKNNVAKVTSGAFHEDSGVKTLKNFDKTKVTSIGEGAFYETAITKLAVPKTLKTIGKYAFNSTTKLKTISGFDKTKLTTIGAGAFAGSSITTLSLPKTLKKIGTEAFLKAEKLKSVKGLENTKVSKIPDYAFMNTKLAKIALPKSLTSIGKAAFAGCASLKSVTGLDKTKVKSIGVSAFYETAVANISLPATCKKLGNQAFGNCASLKTLKISAEKVVPYTNALLYGTKIYKKEAGAAVYVPQAQLDSYLADTTWTNNVDASSFKAI